MTRLAEWLRRLWYLANRRRFDRALLDEMTAHRAALVHPARFGNTLRLREEARDAWGWRWLDDLGRDVRDGLRQVRRAPALSAVVVLTLAIGIGANTAVFSVVRPLLFASLPFRDAGQLVWLSNLGTSGLSGATHQVNVYEAVAQQTTSFSGLTAYFAFFEFGANALTGSGEPRRVSLVPVAPGFFDTLGVEPFLGAGFTREEWLPNGPKALVLSHGFWQRQFGADRSIVGRTVTIGGQPARVAGVLPATFDFASVFTPGSTVDALVPAVLEEMRTWGNTLAIIARLRPGASVDMAREELAAVVPRIRSAHPEWGTFGVVATPLKDRVNGSLRRSVVVLWGAVGLVLLVVCANVSNLLLARSTSRAREFAVRIALGASRRRVVRQLLTEGLLLAATAGAAGAAIGYGLTALVRRQVNLAIPMLYLVEVDATVLVVTASVALSTGLIVTVLPGLRLSGLRPQTALRAESRGATESRRHAVTRSTLVVVEIALACVLVVGGGLLGQSFLRLVDADFGFRPGSATALTVDFREPRPTSAGLPVMIEAVRRVAALPGVDAAGLTDALPLDNNRSWGLGTPGTTYPPGQQPAAFVYVVGPGYLRAMGVPLRSGRDIAPLDTAGTGAVVVASESLAEALYPGRDAIGRIAVIQDRPHQIIGIVPDVRQTRLEETRSPQMYLAHAQRGYAPPTMVVRTSGPIAGSLAAIRHELSEVDAALLLTAARPLDDLVDRAASPRRMLAGLVGAFSAVAVLLASLGIYALVSFGVSQRSREIGVRLALGATAADIRRLVLGGTLRIAAIGVVLGIGGALAVSRVMASVLFGVSAMDARTIGFSAAALLLVAALAGLAPALRASRLQPRTALE
jgi:predicted permease